MATGKPIVSAPVSDAVPVPPAKPKSKSKLPPVPERRRLAILTLRYVLSAKEYGIVRRKVLLKAPDVVSANTPKKSEFEAVVNATGDDDYLPAASRAGLRMLLLSNIALNSWDAVSARLRNRGGKDEATPAKFFSKLNFLSSLSLSVLIVVHRVLYRFFYQLRANLLLPQARGFRMKYPKASKLFLSPKSPAIAASLSGFALAIHPKIERRNTVAVYTFVKALEFYFNRLEDKDYFQDRPWWFGSWLLFPLTSAQLLYTFVFDRDCFPPEYENFFTNRSSEYIQTRPPGYPSHLPFPDQTEIVNAIGKVAELRYPSFSSPILFPEGSNLPASLSFISPVVSPAHPTITSLQCALLHPTEPSCLKTYIQFWASELPRIVKTLAALYTVTWIPRYKRFFNHPMNALSKISVATLRSSFFITGTIGTAWASGCFFQKALPKRVLPKGRFWLSGFLAGLWAVADKTNGRANFLYSFRIFLVSAWKLMVKRGWARPIKNGDVLLFVMSLAVINAVYDRDPHAISGGAARKTLSSLRGKGWKDYIAEKEERERIEKGKGKTN